MALHGRSELCRGKEAAAKRLGHCLVCQRNCGVDGPPRVVAIGG